MKRKILAMLVIAALTLCALCSCFGAFDDKGELTVVLENRDGSYTEYKVTLEDVENKDEGVAGVIEHLAARADSPLSVDMQSGAYGKFINSIGSLVPDAMSGEYVGIYTSVEVDFSTYADVKEINYKGTKLMTSGIGISEMSAADGAVILFRVEVYTG